MTSGVLRLQHARNNIFSLQRMPKNVILSERKYLSIIEIKKPKPDAKIRS